MLVWLRDTVLKDSNISREDLDIFTVVDDPKEVVTAIKKFYSRKR
jgi:predicted Rossmann-fold nucleotide-binding protein